MPTTRNQLSREIEAHGLPAPVMPQTWQATDNSRETVAAILQSFSGEGAAEEGDKKRELLLVVKLATEEHHRLALRTNNRQEVLRAICEGASATEALDRLTENLAAQAAEDTAILHASKFTRIIITPRWKCFFSALPPCCRGQSSCACCV